MSSLRMEEYSGKHSTGVVTGIPPSCIPALPGGLHRRGKGPRGRGTSATSWPLNKRDARTVALALFHIMRAYGHIYIHLSFS
jgi:hypothetical protein